MPKQEFIYCVHFHMAPFLIQGDMRTTFYFTSLAAIYTVFTTKQIGCSVNQLWRLKVSDGVPYRSTECEISREPLTRSPQKT